MKKNSSKQTSFNLLFLGDDKEYVQMMKLMSFSMKLIKYSLNINDVTIIVLSFRWNVWQVGEKERKWEIRKKDMYSYGHIESFITQDINNSVSYTFLYLIFSLSLFRFCKMPCSFPLTHDEFVVCWNDAKWAFPHIIFSHISNLNVSVNYKSFDNFFCDFLFLNLLMFWYDGVVSFFCLLFFLLIKCEWHHKKQIKKPYIIP